LKAIYSIALSQHKVSLGAAEDNSYANEVSCEIDSLANYTYALSTLQFGIVYTDNGTPQNEYMVSQSTQYPAQFATNFHGIGLPSAVYSNITALISDITDSQLECFPDDYNYCQIQTSCANVTANISTQIDNFAFKLAFTDATNGNYIRVPLTAFMTETGTGYNQCRFYI
jgi:hypothetical protein